MPAWLLVVLPYVKWALAHGAGWSGVLKTIVDLPHAWETKNFAPIWTDITLAAAGFGLMMTPKAQQIIQDQTPGK